MTKKELIEAVAKKTGHDEKTVHEVLTGVTNIIMKQVSKNDSVRLVGFGTFSKRRRAARKYYGFDGKVNKARATSIPYFTAGKNFKDAVRKSRK